MNIIEHKINDNVDTRRETAIAHLLNQCFDGIHQGRSYFKQLPHGRFLAWDGAALVGHVGFDFRVIRVGGEIVSIIGIVDLCVAEKTRGMGVGQALLRRAETNAKGQSFALAMADDRRIYTQTGYASLQSADVKFLAIDELNCHSIVQRDLTYIFMVKCLSRQTWPNGSIDMLGYLF